MDRVRLLDGVADRLVVLGPMLRPLIELHWTRDVARWTRLPMEDEALRTHLFGSDRVGFPARSSPGSATSRAGSASTAGTGFARNVKLTISSPGHAGRTMRLRIS